MTRRESWLRGFISGCVTAAIMIMAVLALHPARADVVTELGAGAKLPGTTSLLLQENCHSAVIFETRPTDVGRNGGLTSCGGDDPVFIGWPVAWQKDFGVWSVRAGWFHLSHWFDGGADRELHMDCACSTVTFNWTEWRKKRRGRD